MRGDEVIFHNGSTQLVRRSEWMILRETPRFTISILFDAIGEDSNELGTNIARRRHGGGGLIAARQQAYTLLPLFGLLGEFTRRNSAVKNWPSQLALPRGILASASAEIQPTTLYEADEILAQVPWHWSPRKPLKWPRPSRWSSLIYVSRLHQRHPRSKWRGVSGRKEGEWRPTDILWSKFLLPHSTCIHSRLQVSSSLERPVPSQTFSPA